MVELLSLRLAHDATLSLKEIGEDPLTDVWLAAAARSRLQNVRPFIGHLSQLLTDSVALLKDCHSLRRKLYLLHSQEDRGSHWAAACSTDSGHQQEGRSLLPAGAQGVPAQC